LGLYAMSPSSSDYRMTPGFFGISGTAIPRAVINDVYSSGGWAGMQGGAIVPGASLDPNRIGSWAVEQVGANLPIEIKQQSVRVNGQKRICDGYYEGSRTDHVEVKTSTKGVVNATERVRTQANRDALVVQRGDTVTWMFVNARPSSNLAQALLQAGVHWHQLNVPPWVP